MLRQQLEDAYNNYPSRNKKEIITNQFWRWQNRFLLFLSVMSVLWPKGHQGERSTCAGRPVCGISAPSVSSSEAKPVKDASGLSQPRVNGGSWSDRTGTCCLPASNGRALIRMLITVWLGPAGDVRAIENWNCRCRAGAVTWKWRPFKVALFSGHQTLRNSLVFLRLQSLCGCAVWHVGAGLWTNVQPN